MLELRNEHGIRCTAEVDDNYMSDNRLNVLMRLADSSREDRDNHARSICSADGVITSTEYLRDTYHKELRLHFGKFARKYVPELFVARNLVDERYIPEPLPKRKDGRLRIGFMGSDSHAWDIDLIYPALREAVLLGHEVVVIGIHPAQIRPRWLRKHKTDEWAALDYTHIPWVTEGYRGTALPLDIGFAPLLVNEHTLCKSDIKALEYSMSGAVPIVQNCLVYNRTLKHGETALMASSPAEYTRLMLDAIRDGQMRERIVASCNQYVQEERLLSRNKREWSEAVFGG
jgi:hypothetical protein